nr:transcription factor E4F1-like [Leptinotarsa decemlineata]
MEQEFLGSDDIALQAFGSVLETETPIKREEMKDEDDILLFAQLDNITNNLAAHSNDFHLGQNMDRMEEAANLMQSSFNNNINEKPPTDLNNSSETKLNEGHGTSHYVKYKLQDGKHVKVWECGVCSKEFTHQYTLMRHLPTHTDERKFQCNTCGKAFRQMSTLSQHRAIHSTERPYVCEICHKTFNRVSTLISHRKTHTGLKPHRCHLCSKAFHQKGFLDKNSYSNAIVVDTIKTEAMRLAIESNQTPFALLRPLAGIPVLVRVLPAGDKQMLVPATAEDLKKHSHISITPKSENDKENIDKIAGKPVGSTVQIKIPVVATVVQQNDLGGHMSMSIVSPGPSGEIDSNMGNFVYSSMPTNHDSVTNNEVHLEDISLSGEFEAAGIMGDVNIEFLDEHGRRMGQKDLAEALKEADSSNIILEDNSVDTIHHEAIVCEDQSLAQNNAESTFPTPKVVICENYFQF